MSGNCRWRHAIPAECTERGACVMDDRRRCLLLLLFPFNLCGLLLILASKHAPPHSRLSSGGMLALGIIMGVPSWILLLHRAPKRDDEQDGEEDDHPLADEWIDSPQQRSAGPDS